MTSSPRLRLVAATLVLGVTGALLSAVDGGTAAAEPAATAAVEQPQKPKKPKKDKSKVRWDTTTYYAGTSKVTAHGKVRPKQKVLLQVKVPGSWRTFGKAKANKKGKFSIAGTLDWYGKHKVRATTVGRKPFRRAHKVEVVPLYTPRGNKADHNFTLADNGLRFAWNPCQTIRYQVNAEDVGPVGIELAKLGMGQVSLATGIKTKYVGTTSKIAYPNKFNKLGKGVNFLISWADENEVPDFQKGPIGIGGPDRAYLARDGRGKAVYMITQAGLVLDTNAYLSGVYTQGYFGPKPAWGEVIIHEIGHTFGLAHVNATDEIMYPAAGAGPYPDGQFRGLYDAGDLAALDKNGLNQGCLRKVRSPRGSMVSVVPPDQS